MVQTTGRSSPLTCWDKVSLSPLFEVSICMNEGESDVRCVKQGSPLLYLHRCYLALLHAQVWHD